MSYVLTFFTIKHMRAKCEYFTDLHLACTRQIKLPRRKGFISSTLIALPSGQLILSKRCVLSTQQAAITCVS